VTTDNATPHNQTEPAPQPPKRATLNKRQRRMQKAIAYMQAYMAEYHKQAACLDYSDATLIDDVLYGLGVALHGVQLRQRL
jgi:hypothetical protein